MEQVQSLLFWNVLIIFFVQDVQDTSILRYQHWSYL